MRRSRILCSSLLVLFIVASSSAFDQDVAHAVAGAVTKVDAAARSIAIKTADGAEEVFKFTEKTTVTAAKAVAGGAKTAGVATDMAGKEGTHVVVRYVARGGDKTAIASRISAKTL
jgi:hypothetical protein